VIVGVIVIDR